MPCDFNHMDVGVSFLILNKLIKINLFKIKKETPTAGFKTKKSLCLPQIGRWALPQHRTTIVDTGAE